MKRVEDICHKRGGANVCSRSLATEVVVATTNDVRKPDACVFVVDKNAMAS